MADRRWSELDPAPDIQDTDQSANFRGSNNFRWSFQQLRTWLAGFFEAAGSVNTHNADAGAHPNTFEAAGSIGTHNADSAAHGGVEAAFGAHKGAGGTAEHLTFTRTVEGFVPAPGGSGTSRFLREDGSFEDPGTGVVNPPSNKGQLWTHDGNGNVVIPVGANGLVLEADSATSTGLKWGTKTGAGGGDVTGPGSSSDSSLASFDGTTGKVIKDSGISQSSVSGHIGSSSIHFTQSSIVHNTVSGRSTADAHPTSAITGLDTALAGKLDTAHNTDAAAHGGIRTDFDAHQGAGGPEHAAVDGSTNGFMLSADFTKLQGIEAGAQVNVINSWNGRTDSNIVPASGDYTASQVSNALGTNLSSTMDNNRGVALTTGTVATGGSFTPNPLQGHSFELSGSGDITIASMVQNGQVNLTVPESVGTVSLPTWNVVGARPAGRAGWLWLGRNGTLLLAVWT